MEIFIPLNQMILFVSLISVSFLFSRYKLGLAFVFAFSYYWAFVYNKERLFMGPDGEGHLYFFFGFLLILFAAISFLAEAGSTRMWARITRGNR